MKYAVGIDPPKGFALWNCTKQRFEIIRTLSFWDIIERLNAMANDEKNLNFEDRFTVYIEAPQENAPVWRKGKGAQDGPAFARVCQNVGENKCAAKLLIAFCEKFGINYVACKPTKNSWTKMDAKTFKRLTNIDQRTSEHGRDAALLVWQK